MAKPLKLGRDVPEQYITSAGTIITHSQGNYYFDPEMLLKGRHYKRTTTRYGLEWEIVLNPTGTYKYLDPSQLEDVVPSEGDLTDLDEDGEVGDVFFE